MKPLFVDPHKHICPCELDEGHEAGTKRDETSGKECPDSQNVHRCDKCNAIVTQEEFDVRN